MPFDFLKRKKVDGAGKAPAAGQPAPGHPRSGRGVPFDGLTEEWRIVGNMEVSGRLSDALNKRESMTISDVQWAPVDGSEPLAPAPGLKAVDPYDLIIVLASETSLPPLNDEERTAHPRAQGVVRRRAGGAAVPRRRNGVPSSRLGAGAAARSGDRDVRTGRRGDGIP